MKTRCLGSHLRDYCNDRPRCCEQRVYLDQILVDQYQDMEQSQINRLMLGEVHRRVSNGISMADRQSRNQP